MLNECTIDKPSLRARFRAARNALSPEEQTARDTEILTRLLLLPEYSRCKAVYTYVSKKGEVSTGPLIEAAWANGKQVAVPRWDPKTGGLEFRLITTWEQLKPGAFGVEEPVETCPVADPVQLSGLCVVPGLSFDAEGYRLGYGKGCYDRFLPHFRGITVGLCGTSAVVLRLPREATDYPVQMIVTEHYVRRIAVSDPELSSERKE